MNIDWTITKKEGNHRPTLRYTITLEDHEMELAMERLVLQSSLPVIPEPERGWCLPGEDERAPEWQPVQFHTLSVPWFRTGIDSGFLRLPFRECAEYPEVVNSFTRLRDEYEKLVRQALQWGSIKTSGTLAGTAETKREIAGTVAAKKMLQF